MLPVKERLKLSVRITLVLIERVRRGDDGLRRLHEVVADHVVYRKRRT
ncbi:MAG TPA: hypothetical protein VII08_24495 [Myxococcales bacterium]